MGGRGMYRSRFLNLGTRWRWLVSFTSRLLYPLRKSTRFPLCRRLAGPQIRPGQRWQEKVLDYPISNSDPLVVQPVASAQISEWQGYQERKEKARRSRSVEQLWNIAVVHLRLGMMRKDAAMVDRPFQLPRAAATCTRYSGVPQHGVHGLPGFKPYSSIALQPGVRENILRCM
jgi:hypothetical protein